MRGLITIFLASSFAQVKLFSHGDKVSFEFQNPLPPSVISSHPVWIICLPRLWPTLPHLVLLSPCSLSSSSPWAVPPALVPYSLHPQSPPSSCLWSQSRPLICSPSTFFCEGCVFHFPCWCGRPFRSPGLCWFLGSKIPLFLKSD